MYFPHTRGRISIHSISIPTGGSPLSPFPPIILHSHENVNSISFRWGGVSLLWNGLTLHSSFFICMLHLATEAISSPGGCDSGWSREHIITISYKDLIRWYLWEWYHKQDRQTRVLISWAQHSNLSGCSCTLSFDRYPDEWSQGHPYLSGQQYHIIIYICQRGTWTPPPVHVVTWWASYIGLCCISDILTLAAA